MYYVYEWYIVDTDEVIYVGKGTKNRYKVRKHNKFFNDMIVRYKCESRIVKEFNTEQEAFSYEYDRVNELRRVGQCVCNIYDGGFGGTTECWDEEKRDRYASNNIMKSDRQRKRMSVDNPMKNHDIAEKVNSKKRIPITIGSKTYNSIKEACVDQKVSQSTINGWCVKGITSNGEICKYANKNMTSIFSHANNGQKMPVIYKGKRYESSTALGIELGVSQTTASRWCRQGRDSYGNECRYEMDERTDDGPIKQKHIPIVVNGKWYASKQHASKELGISSYILTQYLNGKRRDTKYICKYGNQQPSQGKSNNSTLEGSETNG